MTAILPLAPSGRNYDWDKSIAFAMAPAATAAAAIYWLEADPKLALIVGLVGFFGTLACALLLARPDHGHLLINDQTLQLHSGQLHIHIPLADIDYATIGRNRPTTANTTDGITLLTDPAKSLSINARRHGTLTISPLDPEALIATLQARRPPAAS